MLRSYILSGWFKGKVLIIKEMAPSIYAGASRFRSIYQFSRFDKLLCHAYLADSKKLDVFWGLTGFKSCPGGGLNGAFGGAAGCVSATAGAGTA